MELPYGETLRLVTKRNSNMNKNVGIPIIVIAVIGVIALIAVLAKTTLHEPEAVHTAAPPWIDEKTGKPKGSSNGSSGTNATPLNGQQRMMQNSQSGGQ